MVALICLQKNVCMDKVFLLKMNDSGVSEAELV